MKSAFKKKQSEDTSDVALNITAMADIFTIILVFILKSYASSAVNLTPTAGLLLPQAKADQTPIEALRIEISNASITVEETPATELKEFSLVRLEKNPNGTIHSLTKAIKVQRQRQIMIAKNNPEVKVDAKVLVIADHRAPYSLIKAVLASAAINGYTDFKMAVVTGD